MANDRLHRDAAPTIQGSCLCGQIAFVVTGSLNDPLNCHCRMCRKAHGAAFRTRASIRTADFAWLKGQALLKRYQSSPGEYRTFCSNCGSNLITELEQNPDVLGVPLGILDDDPGVRPERHVFVGAKAPWFEITDKLPQSLSWPD